jgi:hypothetical protein
MQRFLHGRLNVVFGVLTVLAASNSRVCAQLGSNNGPQHQPSRAASDKPRDPILLTMDLNARLRRLKGVDRPDVPLDAAVLRKVSVSRRGSGWDLGPLMRGGQWQWPTALRAPAFASERTEVNEILPAAVKSAHAAPAGGAGSVKSLRAAIETMHKVLRARAGDYKVPDYSEANRFLTRLESASQALLWPDATKDLAAADALAVSVKSVAELIAYMDQNRQELKAPLPGDEEAYQQLDRALAAYDPAGKAKVRK